MTGTSQATALVSGLAALLLQLEPELGNDELKCMLKTSALPAIEIDGKLAYSPFIQGDGLVDVQRALTIGDRQCGQAELNLSAEIAGTDHFEGPAVVGEDGRPALPGQSTLIHEEPAMEGESDTLRWGAVDHLSRLQAEPQNPPIDWQAILEIERQKVDQLIKSTDEKPQ